MPPYSFSDEQIDALLCAAAPLVPERRAEFVREVADAIAGVELSPRGLQFVIAEAQRRYLGAPAEYH